MSNGDVRQEEFKKSIGITKSSKTNGINYAHRINAQAKENQALFRKSVTVLDELQGVNRYKWYNLPRGLRSSTIERVLYYRGQGIFWYDSMLEKYLFLPYTLSTENNQTIDVYGQYLQVKPLPFNGRSDDKSSVSRYLGTIARQPIYDEEELEELLTEKGEEWCRENCCIIIRDYTEGVSQYCEPKANLQKVWINAQAEIPIYNRTAIFKALTPKILNVGEQGVLDSSIAEIRAIEDSIVSGQTIIPVASALDIQDVDNVTGTDRLIESMLKVYDSYESLRKMHLGIDSNGVFQKQSGITQGEQVNQNNVNYIRLDGQLQRESSLELINKLFGLNVSLEDNDLNEEEEEEKEDEENDKSLPNTDI